MFSFKKVLNTAVLAGAMLLLSAQASASKQTDPKYFEIADVQISEIVQPSFKSQFEPLCDSSAKPDTGKDGLGPKFDGIDLTEILNIGQKIWTIVDNNKPVVNLKVQKADALPLGISSWAELECWQVPESRLFQVKYTNGFGMTVVNLVLRVNYTYGGRVMGQGRYLSQVTILPAQLDVAWAYRIDADVQVVNVTNAGTRSNPVAGMQVDVNWVVRTPLKHSESTETFYVRGDGFYKHLN